MSKKTKYLVFSGVRALLALAVLAASVWVSLLAAVDVTFRIPSWLVGGVSGVSAFLFLGVLGLLTLSIVHDTLNYHGYRIIPLFILQNHWWLLPVGAVAFATTTFFFGWWWGIWIGISAVILPFAALYIRYYMEIKNSIVSASFVAGVYRQAGVPIDE